MTVRTLKESLKCFKLGNVEAQLCFKYRITSHETTCLSPAELLVGRRLRSALSLLKPDSVSSIREKQFESSGIKKTRHFDIDQPVLMGSERTPAIVASSTGNVKYKIPTSDGRLLHRLVDQVIPRGSTVAERESLL